MDKEFSEKCLSGRTIVQGPSVSRISDKKGMASAAEQHRNNAEYFLEGAKALLDISTPLLAVLIGHFAMEHKGNQLLALHGYKIESHTCTQIGLSRIVGRKDLAKKLSRMFASRQSIGYRMTLRQGEEKNTARNAINELAIPFIEEIDKLANEMVRGNEA